MQTQAHNTPTLRSVIADLGLTHSQLVERAGVSKGALHRAMNGQWPRRGAAQMRANLGAALRAHGAKNEHLRALALPASPAKSEAPAVAPAEASIPATQVATNVDDEKDNAMLLENTPLTPQARKHFGLVRSPFVDDVQTRDDIFQSPAVRYARASLLDAANNHGFLALVGESGAGKTTLVEELEERLRDEGRDVIIIRPYVLAMEATDTKGKTLKAGHIAEAIVSALDPAASLRSSPQARFAQVHKLLRDSRRAGRRHLLLIDEAHCLPVATLKHLKRFLELKDGLQRLMGVALVAQPELRGLLHSQNPEVREVLQRCEIVDLPPLDADLEAYLAHKLARFDIKPSAVFAPDAFDALRARLIRTPRGLRAGQAGAVSTCYPLAVHNLTARAMNAAALAGYPVVDAQVVAEC
jgi:type II secretory pathway predicted ATPase ExeA